MRLELRSISGPGHFALYNVDPFGTPVVHMNTRDGIAPATDYMLLPAYNAHAHVKWSFSAPGEYRIGFSASGRLASTGATNTSATTEFTYLVQDIGWRPRITGIVVTNGAVELSIAAAAGRTGRVWSAADLVNWTAVTNIAFLQATQTVRVPVAASARFFRLSLERD